ncbi:MAG: DUF1540 domain-containing protein [Clostridia bacterium]|nr:DUF1540 domain-containing protein [Clostridia bacterium]
MSRNYSIKCDVMKCRHNADGCNCCLDAVKITCSGAGEKCTYCDDYSEKE